MSLALLTNVVFVDYTLEYTNRRMNFRLPYIVDIDNFTVFLKLPDKIIILDDKTCIR